VNRTIQIGDKVDRVKTHVDGFDECMEGGIPEGHMILICGSAGTMKSTLAFSVLYNEVIKNNSRGLYITLEQSSMNLLTHMEGMGMNTSVVGDNLRVLDLTQLRKDLMKGETLFMTDQGMWMDFISRTVELIGKVDGCRLLAIDSLNALYSLVKFSNPRNQLFSFFESFRNLGLTTFFISETSSDGLPCGEFGIEDFMCDGIIRLSMREEGDTFNRYIRCVKMRSARLDTSFFPLLVTECGFKIIRE
jgi:KaiC/GvpD/RAD55 family RecA-like ATPase